MGVFLSTILLVSCVHRVPDPEPALEGFGMGVEIRVQRGEEEMLAGPGFRLVTGDLLTIRVDPPWTAFAHVISVGPTGDAFWLAPSTTVPVHRVQAKIPFPMGPFHVTDPSGVETLHVLWCADPLDEATLAHILGDGREATMVPRIGEKAVKYRDIRVDPERPEVSALDLEPSSDALPTDIIPWWVIHLVHTESREQP